MKNFIKGLSLLLSLIFVQQVHVHAAAAEAISTQETVDMYKARVSTRMKQLFDALMVDSKTAKLKTTAADDLTLLFSETLPNFYKAEFDQLKNTENLDEDWLDESFLEGIFTATIENVTSFCRWAMHDILKVYGGQGYKIDLTKDDPISLFFRMIGDLDKRVLYQKGGAATGVTRLAHWVGKINEVWSIPDMPEFNFNFGAGEQSSSSGQPQQDLGPLIAAAQKTCTYFERELGVLHEKTSIRYQSLQGQIDELKKAQGSAEVSDVARAGNPPLKLSEKASEWLSSLIPMAITTVAAVSMSNEFEEQKKGSLVEPSSIAILGTLYVATLMTVKASGMASRWVADKFTCTKVK